MFMVYYTSVNSIQASRSNVTQAATGSGQNRMIMPANTQLKIINPVTGETRFAAFPPGTTLLAPSGNILQSFAMVPMVQQVSNQVSLSHSNFL